MTRSLPHAAVTLLLALALVSGWSLASEPLPDRISTFGALDRPGPHHVTVRGRLLDEDGEPIEAARLALWCKVQREGFILALVVEGSTDEQGRFALVDVSSEDALALSITPPARYRSWFQVLDLVSGRDHDLGDLTLGWNTIVSGTVRPTANNDTAFELISVQLVEDPEPADRRPARAVVTLDGRSFRLDQISFPRGRLLVRFRQGSSNYHQAGILDVETGQCDRYLEIVCGPVASSSHEGSLHWFEGKTNPTDPMRFQFAGRIVTGTDEPIPGCRLHLTDNWREAAPGAIATSDRAGRFAVEATRANQLWIGQPGFLARFIHHPEDPAAPLILENIEWKAEACIHGLDREIRVLRTRPIAVKGIDPAVPIELSVRYLGDWLPIRDGDPMIIPENDHWLWIKADRKGAVPFMIRLQVEGNRLPLHAGEDIEIPVVLPELAARSLEVVADASPIPGAKVDVVERNPYDLLHDSSRYLLSTLTTDRAGRIEIDADVDAIYEVFVYAPGMDPVRALWPGGATRMDLRAQQGSVRVALAPEERLRVFRRGTARPVAVAWSSETRLSLSEGSYDWVIAHPDGTLKTGGPVEVTDQPIELDAASDERPRLHLKFRSAHEVSLIEATRSTATGGASGALSWSSSGGGFDVFQWQGLIERVSDREYLVTFHGSGEYALHIHAGDLPAILTRVVQVEMGTTTTLEVPELTARLKGSMRTYEDHSMMHGTAGPRLILLPRDDGWIATVGLPDKDEDSHEFVLSSLPAGRYDVFQHLIGTVSGTHSGKPFHHASTAYGGASVSLSEGEETTLADFADLPLLSLSVIVRTAAGRPFRAGNLAIRDRMWEAWRRIAEGTSSLAYASDPIPRPPQTRLTDGPAVFRNVRHGRIEFLLTTDAGQIHEIARDWQGAPELVLEVPDGL